MKYMNMYGAKLNKLIFQICKVFPNTKIIKFYSILNKQINNLVKWKRITNLCFSKFML